jgi:hypothetical protein
MIRQKQKGRKKHRMEGDNMTKLRELRDSHPTIAINCAALVGMAIGVLIVVLFDKFIQPLL